MPSMRAHGEQGEGRRWFGDQPDVGWYGEPPSRDSTSDGDKPSKHRVDGDTIRFMWDYGVEIPLWDVGGLLREEASWLRRELTLSEDLIADLRQWGREMNELDSQQMFGGRAGRHMDRRARALVERLGDHLATRFAVEYRAW